MSAVSPAGESGTIATAGSSVSSSASVRRRAIAAPATPATTARAAAIHIVEPQPSRKADRAASAIVEPSGPNWPATASAWPMPSSTGSASSGGSVSAVSAMLDP